MAAGQGWEVEQFISCPVELKRFWSNLGAAHPEEPGKKKGVSRTRVLMLSSDITGLFRSQFQWHPWCSKATRDTRDRRVAVRLASEGSKNEEGHQASQEDLARPSGHNRSFWEERNAVTIVYYSHLPYGFL